QDLIFSLFLILLFFAGIKFAVGIVYLELAEHITLPISDLILSVLSLIYFIVAIIGASIYRKEVKEVFFTTEIKYLVINIIILLFFMNLLEVFPLNYLHIF
ncbi:hypothetical protein KJ742_04955, partial [Patescibacteria group bacterium]|nr:hypothetical protein [Patescibacteria group bacterium]